MNDHQSTKNLAPEDYQQIKDEHFQLHRLMDTIRNVCINLDNQLTCQSCDNGKKASCLGQLVSFTHNLTYLTDNHFQNEERIIRRRPHFADNHDHFLDHQQDHANIMAELRNIARQLASIDQSGNVAVGYRKLYKRMSVMLRDHDHLYDGPFIQSTKS